MRRFEQEVRGGDPVEILLARKDIPAGTLVTPQHLSEYVVPDRYTSGRNVLAADQRHVVGTRVSTTVRANEPLLWTDIARMRQDRTLSNLVQPGMVASEVSGQSFGGLLGPGDRVDVVLLSKDNIGLLDYDGERKRAVTLLQAALVLSVGGKLDRSRSSGAVTLLLSPEQAQLLMVARDRGVLQLVLRNPDDLAVRETVSTVTHDDLLDPKRRAQFIHAHTRSVDAKGGQK